VWSIKGDDGSIRMEDSKSGDAGGDGGTEDDEGSHDDGVSKLTFLEHDDDEEEAARGKRAGGATHPSKIDESSLEDRGSHEDGRSSSSSSRHDGSVKTVSTSDVDRLLREKAGIEMALQTARQQQQYHSVTVPEVQQEDDRDDSGSAVMECDGSATVCSVTSSTVSLQKKAAAIMDDAVDETIAELTRKLEREESKSAVLEQQVASLSTAASTAAASSAELDAALKSQEEMVYKHLQEVKSLRESLDKAAVEMEGHRAKETDSAKLENEVKELNDKCWGAQNDTHKVRALMKDQELQFEEEKERLEGEIEVLKERLSGSDSFSIGSSTVRSSGEGFMKNLGRDPSSIGSSVSGEGFMESLGRDPSSIGSSVSGGVSLAGSESASSQIVLRMQLATANKEAEDMRSFNAVLRKEHNETISELDAELEKERSGKTECLSQIVKQQFDIATLEHELEDARDEVDRAVCSSVRDDSREMEVELYKLKDKLREKLEEAEESRIALDALKLELQEKEMQFKKKERKFEEKEAHLERKFMEKEAHLERKFMENERNFDEKEAQLKHEEENVDKTLVEKVRQAEKSFREKEREAEKLFQKKVQKVENQLKAEFQDKEKMSQQTNMQQIRDLKKKIQQLQQMLEASEDCVQQLEAKREQHSSDAKEEQKNSLTFMQQIRDLKKKIQQLQQTDDEHTQKLWEANKLRERALQDKEDECLEKVRELKKQHEIVAIEREDSYLVNIRESKKRAEEGFRTQEESYLKQLHDAKKKEQSWIEKEDTLLKRIENKQLKDSFSEMEIDNLIRQKDAEFENGIAKVIAEKDEEFSQLKDDLKRLKEEQKDATEDKVIVNELEIQLSEAKKEYKHRARKHKSEMNQVSNAIEMQKSKEGRLQSHIASLEKQITDMVADYEARLQEAFYENM